MTGRCFRRLWLVLTATLLALHAGAADGWSTTRIDLDVDLDPKAGSMVLSGTLHARLEGLAESGAIRVLIGSRQTDDGGPALEFTRVEADGGTAELASEPMFGHLNRADVELDSPAREGDEIAVRFECRYRGPASQLAIHPDAAFASWTAAWHPYLQPDGPLKPSVDSSWLHAPGTTTLRLPPGWTGITEGRRVERVESAQGVVEVWETPDGIARSFAAGPYRESVSTVGDRQIRVLLQDEQVLGAETLARILGQVLLAQEARFGPFPFPGYGVVEVPGHIPGQDGWYAASQQGFILAKSSAFGWEHGNLPLWSHEMCHGWWGNLVGSSGPGSKWVSESLAQLGAVVGIEALEGRDARNEFLAFSRSGYSPVQCAAGYFSLVRLGEDEPIAAMQHGGATHSLADSKGVWIYHMLRERVGEECFFGVLREIVDDLAHRDLSVAEMRRRFVRAAPEHELESFFEQWLDRTGAPVLDVDWHATLDGRGVVLALEQAQPEAPFAFELEVELELKGGERVVETVSVTDRHHVFELSTASRVMALRLDPGRRILMWRPEYGPRPDGEAAVPVKLDPALVAVVAGSYRVPARDAEVQVVARDGVLYLEIAGGPSFRLAHRDARTFAADVPGGPIVLEFDAQSSPAASFQAHEGERTFVGERVAGR